MYILFCGECYYANGGANDFAGTFNIVEEAVKIGEQLCEEGLVGAFGEDPTMIWAGWSSRRNVEWWHVFCMETMQIVAKSKAIPLGGG